MRLIDADALAVHMFHGYGTEVTPVDIDAEIYKLGWNDAIDAIMDNAPTIEPERGCDECIFKPFKQFQPERKKGNWIKISPANIYECSECGKNVMTDDISAYDFCHGCGADMRPTERDSYV